MKSEDHFRKYINISEELESNLLKRVIKGDFSAKNDLLKCYLPWIKKTIKNKYSKFDVYDYEELIQLSLIRVDKSIDNYFKTNGIINFLRLHTYLYAGFMSTALSYVSNFSFEHLRFDSLDLHHLTENHRIDAKNKDFRLVSYSKTNVSYPEIYKVDDLIEEGKTFTEISYLLGIHINDVFYYWGEPLSTDWVYKVFRSKERAIDIKEKTRILNRIISGESCDVISKDEGIHRATIYRWKQDLKDGGATLARKKIYNRKLEEYRQKQNLYRKTMIKNLEEQIGMEFYDRNRISA